VYAKLWTYIGLEESDVVLIEGGRGLVVLLRVVLNDGHFQRLSRKVTTWIDP
jgi:hypothetical protein